MSLSACVTATAEMASLSAANYSFLQRFIYQESGIVVEADKRYLLDARLLPIVRDEKMRSLDELSERLASRSSGALCRRVVDAMTTNETLFFRDRTFFDALRTSVLPEIFERVRGRKVRIWSSAASTGQEAYSVAMMLLEMGRDRSEFEIVGTDISGQALDRARAGQYVQFEVNRGLAAPLLMKYFSKQGVDWTVKPEVRALASFTCFDLRQSFRTLGQFDLVLCRNVLIYFDEDTKRKILENLAQALMPEGLLALGGTELVMNVPRGLERRMFEKTSFYARTGG
jgi:chemotaxis protein methyltransferase CheR